MTRAQETYVRVYFKGNPVGSDSTAFHYLEVINDVIKTVKASEPNGTDVLRITDSAMIESEKVPISYDGVRFASDSTILDSAKYLLMVLRKAGYISQYGIDDSNFKDEQGKASIKNLSKNDLLYPEGVNVAIFARRNLGIQLLAYWAASGYIEGLNVLLISSKDSIIFDEDGGKRVYATDAVFLDKELNLVYGRFDKPVPIHTVAHSDNDVGDFHRKLDDFEIPTLSSIRSMELTTDKIKFGRYLQEQKFLTPDFIVIDRGTSAITVRSRLQEFFDRQKEKFGNEEIVIKPPSEFASEGVGMFSSDEIKQAVEHVISLYSWSDKIMVQERVSNKLWTNKNGDIIDYNFRVLSTWDQDEVIVTEDMIEIRYQPIGKDPVSKVKGASVMTLKQYYEAIGIDENDRKSFSARLGVCQESR
ncbi:MAG: hypothetical protein KAR20_14830, partial [Candidatus Heimdallarchaeota archaeon]|nr:hypothetical protein [Candidatus Heimdallarchaeota archaeon]